MITVPAYFNDKQRHATQMAAKRAGIIARELLSEPTAAAISYGYKPDSEEVKTILVYDFGGGTFDSCLITAAGNQFIESGKAGDLWLGGDDIDAQLMRFVKEKVAQEEALEDVDALIAAMPHYQRVRFLGDFKSAVERAKIDLSSAESAAIIENLGLKPRRSTTALLLNIRTFTKYMLKCEVWKKPIRFDFTPHPNKSRYCGAHWAV